MSSETTTIGRPLRADARRNRARVLEAARATFAEQGLDAQIDDIAARAGVGVGTIYRHFPTKDALVEALVVDRFDRIADLAEPSFAVEDSWEALTGFLWRAARLQTENRLWAQLTAERPALVAEVTGPTRRLHDVTGRLLRRAQDAGTVRKDVTADDIGVMMCGLCAVIESTGGHEGDRRWERYFALSLDGLRST